MVTPEDEDIIRPGEAIYNERLRNQLEPEHRGEFLAIDPDGGDYYLGRTLEDAVGAARAARRDRVVYAVRVGYDVAAALGGGWA